MAALLKREETFATLLVSPALLALIVTTTLPLIYLIWNSFQNINHAMPFTNGFAGLDNYAEMLGDPSFWHSLKLIAIHTIGSVVLQVVLSLGLALLVTRIPRGQSIFRIIAILPMVPAPVVVGLFWRTLMLAPNFGIIDFAVKALGFDAVNWLGAPVPALISVIMIYTWQWTPFAFLVFLTSLASLPLKVYEAARIDCANALRRFVHITLPLIRPVLVIVVINLGPSCSTNRSPISMRNCDSKPASS